MISIYALDIEQFYKDGRGYQLLLILTFFGFSFIPFTYCIGFFFKKPDDAYKYSILISFGIFSIPKVLQVSATYLISERTGEIIELILDLFSTYNLLTSSLSTMVKENGNEKTIEFALRLLNFVGQSIVFLSIAIYWDNRLQNKFKGEDHK